MSFNGGLKALRTAVKKKHRFPSGCLRTLFVILSPAVYYKKNYDIRTIQELVGHSDARTTMMYTHTVKSVTLKEAKSPLDF